MRWKPRRDTSKIVSSRWLVLVATKPSSISMVASPCGAVSADAVSARIAFVIVGMMLMPMFLNVGPCLVTVQHSTLGIGTAG
mmetsp:Transcript_120231/g.385254  ORF Transcript_120231/g.385254 Transcript_120231/m.385254 type:complete len:82 (+) Transcript_120231:1891-2136(+)